MRIYVDGREFDVPEDLPCDLSYEGKTDHPPHVWRLPYGACMEVLCFGMYRDKGDLGIAVEIPFWSPEMSQ